MDPDVCFVCGQKSIGVHTETGVLLCSKSSCRDSYFAIRKAVMGSAAAPEQSPIFPPEAIVRCYRNATQVLRTVTSLGPVKIPTAARETVFTRQGRSDVRTQTSIDATRVSLFAENARQPSTVHVGWILGRTDDTVTLREAGTGAEISISPSDTMSTLVASPPSMTVTPQMLAELTEDTELTLSYLLPPLDWTTSYDLLVNEARDSLHVSTVLHIQTPSSAVPLRASDLHLIKADIDGVHAWDTASAESHSRRQIRQKRRGEGSMMRAAAPMSGSGEGDYEGAPADIPERATAEQERLPRALIEKQLPVQHGVDLIPQTGLRLTTYEFDIPCQLLGVVNDADRLVAEAIYIDHNLVKDNLRDLLQGHAHVTLANNTGVEDRAYNVPFLPTSLPDTDGHEPVKVFLGLVAGMTKTEVSMIGERVEDLPPSADKEQVNNKRVTAQLEIRISNPLKRTNLAVEIWKPVKTESGDRITYSGDGIRPVSNQIDWITGVNDIQRINVPFDPVTGEGRLVYQMSYETYRV